MPVLRSVALLTTLLAYAVLCAGCQHQNFAFPAPLSLEPPVIVTIEQLTAEYRVDAAGADAKYSGKKLVFYNIKVEDVHLIYYQSGGAIAAPMIDYFSSGIVNFQLLDYRGVQQRVQAGFILNLAGICQGLTGDKVFVKDCWASSVQGDLGAGLPPLFQY
jgi:hypothetical protein